MPWTDSPTKCWQRSIRPCCRTRNCLPMSWHVRGASWSRGGRHRLILKTRFPADRRPSQPELPTVFSCPSAWNQRTNNHYAAAALWKATDGVGLSGADSEAAVTQFLARNPGTSYVALDDAKLVATILLGHDGRRGLSHHLAVAASHRRQRIGKWLVAAEGLAALGPAGIQKCHLLVFAGNAGGGVTGGGGGASGRTGCLFFSTTWCQQFRVGLINISGN